MSYRIAGIDVHKKMLAVVVADVEAEGEYQFERRQFGSNPDQLRLLSEWLIEQQVEEIVMESTAQYWRPVWGALERYWKPTCQQREGAGPMSGTLHLAQALSNRGQRGRKNDFRDAERLVKRLVAQELTLSFVPDAEQRLWRTVTHRKYQLRRNRVRLQNQLESLLEEAHIKLSSLVSDLLGTSARRMLKGLADGVTPVAIEVTLAVQHELQARLDEVERLRKEQVERARYEAELAQPRYMRVDPDNRLVADTLEADWNRKLRTLQEAQKEYEQQRQKDCMAIDEELRSRLHTLATDFPRLWRDPNTPDRERKRLVHLLLEDVTLIKREQLLIHIRFPGGATRTLQLPRPRRATVTQQSVIAEVERLLDEHSHEAIANILNSRGSVSGYGKPFTGRMIGRMRIEYGLKSRFERLRAKGMLTLDEMAPRLGICTDQVKAWRAARLLRAHLCNDKNEYLYQDPGANPPRKARGVRLSKRLKLIENVSQRPSEVQCEA